MAEYIAEAHAIQVVMWLWKVLTNMGKKQQEPTMVYEDKHGFIKLSMQERCNGRMRHIDVKYHLLSDQQGQGVIDLQYCITKEMTANMLTKKYWYQ